MKPWDICLAAGLGALIIGAAGGAGAAVRGDAGMVKLASLVCWAGIALVAISLLLASRSDK